MKKAGPDILFFPPLLSVAAPVLAVALEWLAPLRVLPAFGVGWQTIVGVALAAAAGGLAISGAKAFRAQGTQVDPRQAASSLVKDGPYRFTRNPMYLGMVILQVSLAFLFSLDWALPLAIILWALLHFGVVLREKAYLSEKFGNAYAGFLTETRRWI